MGLLRKTAPGALALCLVIAAACAATPAKAAIPAPVFTQFGELGSGAGQLRFEGGGVAADPATGHVFLSERLNNRISEFTAWGEFVKAWGFGVADGSPEAQTCGPLAPELKPEASLCQSGASGAQPGQLNAPNGIAVGADGEVYVFERDNSRVQVFEPDGSFSRMFGGEVNKDTGADVCTAADVEGGDECGAGIGGSGPSEFSVSSSASTRRDYIDIAPDGTVYVGDQNRIQKFDEDGNFLGALNFTGTVDPETGKVVDGEAPEPGPPGALAVEPESGDLYFSYAWVTEAANSYRIDESTGEVIEALAATAPEAFAPAPVGGSVYLSDDPFPNGNSIPEDNPHLVELDALGALVDSCCSSTSKGGENVWLPGMAASVVAPGGEWALYVAHDHTFNAAFVEVRGPAPESFLPPPSVPPDIELQQAIAVGETEASLRAEINPNFWSDTSFHVEYGSAPCSGGGCTETAETTLGAGVVRQPIESEPVELAGLEPNTTYHYRFVADSGGGDPVAGPDATFTTAAAEVPAGPCANDEHRDGAGARLADCRAYELVSPVEKLGGEILVQLNIQNHPARLNQAAPSGEAITYSSYRAFGEDAEGSPYQSQYVARRGAGGWSSESISPAQENGVFNGGRIDSNYRAFSEDLGTGWLVQDADPPLAAGAVPGFYNLYRRDADGSHEALSTVEPPGVGATDYVIEVQGVSADGSRTVFRANAKLTANASPGNSDQVYEWFKGNLRLVSLKPEGSASAADASAGSAGGAFHNNREANAETAVSEDGTKIYWSEAGSEGKLYVRVNAVNTVAVSSGAASFWAATPTGSQALYSEGGALKRFTLAGASSVTLVGSGVQGILGASEDLTRVYLISSAALGGGAEAGERNLYLYEEGQPLEFIAALSEGDFLATLASPMSLSPRQHLSHVSEDGGTAVFMSRAALSGADNVDQESGEADAEVFRYEAATEELRCISCSPTNTAPRGRTRERDYHYASRIPTWEFQLHEPRAIAAGGNRVYFNSLNSLAPADTNEAEDAYQWEALGSGTCETEASPGHNPAAGGCVTLISSGEGTQDSEFVDASADGRDAFFLTGQSLVGWDPGQFDLYDAREGGGLPAPPAPPVGCDPAVEGSCQPPPPAPPAPTPNVSQGFAGPGNAKPKRACRKGQVRKKGKCVKKAAKHKKKAKGKKRKAKQSQSRRAGR